VAAIIRDLARAGAFSLNGYDALQAMALIRRAGLLVERTGEGRRTVVVDSVDAVPAEPLPDYPPGTGTGGT
jgi:hypothetical protein